MPANKKLKRRRQISRNMRHPYNNVNLLDLTTTQTEEMILQFNGNEVPMKEVSEKVKQDFTKNSNGANMENVRIYVKPEENKAYYVVNGAKSGSVDLV